ncbi:MAG: carbohydrate kinase family protein [Candidatus Heteroscillospira sp.]
MAEKYALVIGAVNVDICGRPFEAPVECDSNPGRVSSSLGGVGRNIAHNLRLLGVPVRFITALGGDAHAEEIRRSCAHLGIDLSCAAYAPDMNTSTYLYITDEDGDMVLAVCDSDISGCITPEYLSGHMDVLNNAAVVVIDGNLAPDTISWICENCTAPLFADPVSAAKAPRLRRGLGRLHTFKPNQIEAELLTGIKITDEDSMAGAVDALLATGLRRVFLSLGRRGVYCADGCERALMPIFKAPLINATGAGDAFMAALAWGYLQGLSLTDSAKAGLAASSIALESYAAINPQMSAELLKARMK